MAGEFSRQLGVKVLAGQKRLAGLGFKHGGIPGYGLRRMLVSADSQPKQELAKGERKNIATDRVIFIPGPLQEVQCVNEIYRMLISEKLSVHPIAQELNRRGVEYIGNSEWDYQSAVSCVHLCADPFRSDHFVGTGTSGRSVFSQIRLSIRCYHADSFNPVMNEGTHSAHAGY
jgi:hypothetical protein